MIQAHFAGDFESWRQAARQLMQEAVPPERIDWLSNTEPQQMSLDVEAPAHISAKPATFTVSPDFFKLATSAACVRDVERWQVLYRVLYRLRFENPNLLKVSIDADVLKLQRWAKSVGRDIHKMHAFVRFKRIDDGTQERFVAWHQPEHLIVKLAVPFFVRRFGDKPWSIFTPDLSAHWDCKELTFSPGLLQHEFPHRDEMDEIWKTYYRSIFNPARIKLKAMNADMPSKYWASLPEAEIIRDLVQEAPQRLLAMARNQDQGAEVPKTTDWNKIRSAAHACTACPLYENATQTVFGEGPLTAHVMIVGEQPGDQEDVEGKPFVGPAGEVLDQALAEIGVPRDQIYVTNAVKHFKWEARGKFRLHKKPTGSEMHACRPWLEAEIAKIKPRLVVLLGTTAGNRVPWPLTKDHRGKRSDFEFQARGKGRPLS